MMKYKLLSAILLFTFSCKDKTQEGDQNLSTQEKTENWADEIKSAGNKMDIGQFNEFIERATSARQSWAYSPIAIAQQFVGNEMETPVKSVYAISKSGAELITSAWVVIIEENLMDDSLADRAYLVQLDLGGSIWKVTSAYQAHRCRTGRGDVERFHAQPCH